MPAFDSLDDVEHWASGVLDVRPQGRWLKRPWLFGYGGLAYFVNGALVGCVSHDIDGWRACSGKWQSSPFKDKRDAKLLVQKTCKARAPKVQR